ncbi:MULTISPECIES: motility protein A [Larsenimonas]|uniref:MotA/TolQ/ExbB proton channel family protein n=1 Tax=Larsenimonas suaedae TaxID=1851019 RepID=A0ABU1GVM0_9GAMM|nr:MotA/TolQ/ExbB proton channel family protein [Larsenimonas suaedae]MCM2973188.1 MotA/TolQ/ExbB proton channel family protein [Larsenimonas suaedae]MCM5705643.1 MotA/TolQ/ExbB proton channel family protein [Larsenimonas salina]MDR5896081.1 MotA/TolQ/ExbB proton channel family protein [Larsenimonas suaedae]
MNASTLIGLSVGVLLLVAVLAYGADSPLAFLNIPGLSIVIAGTLAATFLSFPLKELSRVFSSLPAIFRREDDHVQEDIAELVNLSRQWMHGQGRNIEKMLEQTRNPFLKTGISLVIDNIKEEEILDLMRWRIARLKARERAEAQIFRTMAAYAPAFGMLGTLVGLINMLSVMETGDISVIGPSMGIALLTTFYGILLANLVFKPIAVKLERRTERRVITMNMVLEGVSMLCRRRLPSFIEATLQSFIAEYRDQDELGEHRSMEKAPHVRQAS